MVSMTKEYVGYGRHADVRNETKTGWFISPSDEVFAAMPYGERMRCTWVPVRIRDRGAHRAV